MSPIPSPQQLTDMAWEIHSVLEALDELTPPDRAECRVTLHGLISIGLARAQELANHLAMGGAVKDA